MKNIKMKLLNKGMIKKLVFFEENSEINRNNWNNIIHKEMPWVYHQDVKFKITCPITCPICEEERRRKNEKN